MPEARPAPPPISLRLFAFILTAAVAMSVGHAGHSQTHKKPADKTAKAKKKEMPPKEVRVWTFSRPDGVPNLVYGFAGGEPSVSFSCQPQIGLMRVVTHIGSRGIKPGDSTPIKLSNGNVRMEFAGTAFAAGKANENVDIGGSTKIDAKFFGLFRAGDTLLLDIPGRKRGLPVKGSQQAADAFEKACVK